MSFRLPGYLGGVQVPKKTVYEDSSGDGLDEDDLRKAADDYIFDTYGENPEKLEGFLTIEQLREAYIAGKKSELTIESEEDDEEYNLTRPNIHSSRRFDALLNSMSKLPE